jgi:hypothetical protein
METGVELAQFLCHAETRFKTLVLLPEVLDLLLMLFGSG